jgi:hypothetical protein
MLAVHAKPSAHRPRSTQGGLNTPLTEYFDPTDGKGVGGADFSWTAAIWLLLEDAGATA